jgi:hypothetical protein
VEVILASIREEYDRWRLTRLFRSDSFGFPEPMPWIGGVVLFEHEELPPPVGSILPFFGVVSFV